jgi:hypothetical protein
MRPLSVDGGVLLATAAPRLRELCCTNRQPDHRVGDLLTLKKVMPKNQAIGFGIGIAISSALVVLSQADATQAAIPLTTVRVHSGPANPPQMRHADGDFDRAFVVQRTPEAPNPPPGVQESLGEPTTVDRRPFPASPSADRKRLRFIPATRLLKIRD